MKLDERILHSIRHYFEDKPVLNVYLFGSHAKNEAFEDSDLDLLIDLDYENNIGLGFIKMKLDLEEMLKVKVDLVSSNGLSKFIKPFIDQEKKLIYAK